MTKIGNPGDASPMDPRLRAMEPAPPAQSRKLEPAPPEPSLSPEPAAEPPAGVRDQEARNWERRVDDLAGRSLLQTPGDPLEGQYLADAGGPVADARSRRQSEDEQLRLKAIRFLSGVIHEGQQFQVNLGLSDKLMAKIDPSASGQTIANIKEMADRSQEAFRQADDHLERAARALGRRELEGPNGYFQHMQNARAKVALGLDLQAKVNEDLALNSGQKAEWAKFVRDAAVESEVALLSLYFGGAGGLAGKFGHGATQLAEKSPKLYAVINSLATNAAIDAPHILSRAQDLAMGGMPVLDAVKQSFLEVGASALVGSAFEGVGWALGSREAFPKLKEAVHRKLGPLFDAVKDANFVKAVDGKIHEFLYGTAPADILRRLGAAHWHPNSVVREILRDQGPQRLFDQLAFHRGTLTHSKELTTLLGPSVKGHDLVGDGNKLQQAIRKGMSSRINLDDVGKQLQQIGEKELARLLADMPGGAKLAKTLAEQGPRAVPISELEEAARILAGKGEKKLSATLAGSAEVRHAIREHNQGALHHLVWDEMKKFKSHEEFAAALSKGEVKVFDPHLGKEVVLTDAHVLEASLDVVNARRDVTRPYKKDGSPVTREQLVTDGHMNSVQREWAGRAFDLHDWAEKTGLVRPFGENLEFSRLRYAWVFGTEHAKRWVMGEH